MSVSNAARKDDRLAMLRALRRKLAASLDETTSARDIAPLVARMTDVTAQIDEIVTARRPKETVTDELAARRARATGASGPVAADGGRGPRTR